ncbi:hypothetical protein QDQ73_17640 [Citrobacter freundii]|nr:hypothetical protein [Citrobacter sp.]MDR4046873.1 hypothetical protein [Citrobacter sp.]
MFHGAGIHVNGARFVVRVKY